MPRRNTKRRKRGKPVRAEGNDDSLPIDSAFLNQSSTELLTDSYRGDCGDEKRQEFETAVPFPYAALPELVQPEFLNLVRKELLSKQGSREDPPIEFRLRRNDLYHFFQSADLGKLLEDESVSKQVPHLCKLRDVLFGEEFRAYIKSLTGITTTGQVDLFASVYADTHRLLCHDDNMGTRRVAFILYLVDDEWSEAEGGQLALHAAREDGMPENRPEKLLVPKFNQLACFAVSTKSFHQVMEVTLDQKKVRPRLAVGGWLHGEPLENSRDAMTEEMVEICENCNDVSFDSFNEAEVAEWLHKDYCGADTTKQIAEHFAQEGHVFLEQALKKEVWQKLRKEIEQIQWNEQGPPLLHLFDKATQLPPTWTRLRAFLHSDTFASLLHRWTMCEPVNARSVVRRFSQGHYVLQSDTARQFAHPGLDVTLYLTPPSVREWQEDWGGVTHYVDSEEELLNVTPSSNSLIIVYRDDAEVMPFVDFVNHHARYSVLDMHVKLDTNEVPDSESDSNDEDDEDEAAEE